MRQRPLLPAGLALVAVGTLAVFGAALPATAAVPALHVVTGVSGTGGSVTAIALSTDGARGYVVDGSTRLRLLDTATSAITGTSDDFAAGGFGAPTDVDIVADRPEVAVSTSNGWLVQLHPDGTIADQMGLPGVALGGVAGVVGGASVMAAPSAANPTGLLRFNLGLSVSPLAFAADSPATPRPSSLARIAVGPGNGNDNDVLAAGSAAGSGVLYIFDSPFALSGQVRTVLLPGTVSAQDVVVSPSGTQALVTAPADHEVFLVNLDSASPDYGTITATVAVPHLAVSAAYTPDGGGAYVVGDNAVSAIDTVAGTLASTVLIDTSDAAAVAVSPSGHRVWIGDAEGGGGIGMLSDSAVTAGQAATSGTTGTALSAAFTASGFDRPVTWSISPSLPLSLSFDPATGTVSGTPSEAQVATTFTVTATSADGNTASTTWTLTVTAAVVPTPSPSPTATSGASPSPSGPGARATALAATGGTPAWPVLASGAALLATGAGLLLVRRRIRTR